MKTLESRISDITTQWTEIFVANGQENEGTNVSCAQQNVLRTYSDSIFRYLLGATRNADIAEELSQEFAFRFVRGDLANASPHKGRFRDYLRVVLRNLVNDYHRRTTKSRELIEFIQQKNVSYYEQLESDFQQSWRENVIASTWNALANDEKDTNNYFYSVLRHRASHPKQTSSQMAAEFSEKIGKDVSADWVRQKLRRSRLRFGELLMAEVQKTIHPRDDFDQLHEELADLELLDFLRDSHPKFSIRKPK